MVQATSLLVISHRDDLTPKINGKCVWFLFSFPMFTNVDWVFQVAAATICWAMSDICSDAAIQEKDEEPQETGSEASKHGHLTGEQGALMSVCVTLCYTVIFHLTAGPSLNLSHEILAQALAGGAIHFLSYMMLLKAFEHSSSTQITPLLQMSAVWLLPIAAVDTWVDGGAFFGILHPVHLFGFVCIIVGGLAPVTAGKFDLVFSLEFWKASGVGLCLGSEFLVACYTLLLHQNSFDSVAHAPGTTSISASEIIPDMGERARSDLRSVFQFFILSRYAAACFAFVLYASVPRLRREALGFFDPSCNFTLDKPVFRPELTRSMLIKALGDCFSITGLLIGSVAYALYYEPSIVNAAEGGFQQLFNLVFAVCLSRVCQFGRPVTDLSIKVVAFLLVAIGLVCSAI